MNQINFQFNEVRCTIPNRTILRNQLLRVFKKYKFKLDQLDYIFCSDEYLLEINRNNLQHDFYTDIITFDLSDTDSIHGEIYISIDRVRENASTFKSSLKDELLRVIFHGALHLCGLKDKSANDIIEMRKAEDFFITSFNNEVSRVTVS